MRSRSLLLIILAAIALPVSFVIALEAPAKQEAKTDKPATEALFQDVLDTPALKKAHPGQSLLVGVALAGNRVVAVGQHGLITYSDNHGKDWTQAAVPVSSDLLAVHFASPAKGWAVGHDGVVLHTEDSGASWTKQFDGRAAAQVMVSHYMGSGTCGSCHNPMKSPEGKPEAAQTAEMMDEIQKLVDQGPDKPFLDVWFENENSGFIVGAFNLIFRTTDGGKSWVPWFDRIDNPKRYHLYSVRPVGKELFVTAEQGTIFKLDVDKGRFQEIKTPYTGTLFGITGKPGAIVAYGMRGNTFRSRDGGASWDKVQTGVPAGLTGGVVTPDGKIVLVSQGGHVLLSGDDGASFAQVKLTQPVPASAVAALDGTTLALAGQRGVSVQSIK